MRKIVRSEQLLTKMFLGCVLLVFMPLCIKLSSTETELRKCCPVGQIFTFESDMDIQSVESDVNCVSASLHNAELLPIAVEANLSNISLPICEVFSDTVVTPIDKFDTAKGLQIPACVDASRINSTGKNELIVIHCRPKKDNTYQSSDDVVLPKIASVKKCCPKNSFYDKNAKLCVSRGPQIENATADQPSSFSSLLPLRNNRNLDFLYLTTGPPNCSQVVFDIEIDVADLHFEDEILRVKTKGTITDQYVANGENDGILMVDEKSCLDFASASFPTEKLVLRVCGKEEVCQIRPCIRKCCPEDQLHVSRVGCTKMNTYNIPGRFRTGFLESDIHEGFPKEDHGLLIGKRCKYGMYRLQSDEKWNVTPEGHVEVYNDNDRFTMTTYDHEKYCMDLFSENSSLEVKFYTFICFPEPAPDESPVRYLVNAILQLISCAFLLITLVVYVCLPSLQNLHGKTLMCHSGSLLLAFCCLVTMSLLGSDTMKLNTLHDIVKCKGLGYTMLFAFLSTFSWLNVMCFDIWWTFGGLRGGSMRSRGHKKKFIFYCLYAWGLACTITVIGIIFDHTALIPYDMRPNIGVQNCWFPRERSFYGQLIFFIIPISFQITVNIALFIATAVYCTKVKAEINRVVTDSTDLRKKRFQADQTKLIMNVKLFIVMGIPWAWEIVSFMVNTYASELSGQEKFFYVSDAFNCLQGLLIFVLFVLKKRVYFALLRRLGFDKKRSSTNATNLQDPYRVKKSASNSTLMSTFQVSFAQ